MARKPGTRTSGEFALFNVVYEDGTQRSNRRVPMAALGGLDDDESGTRRHQRAGQRDRGKIRRSADEDHVGAARREIAHDPELDARNETARLGGPFVF